jgi:hypothetical protein
MTDDDIQLKGFFATWKVLRQRQSEDYYKREGCIKRYLDGEITKDQVVILHPGGIDVIIEKQKKRNLDMFVTAILATSDDSFEVAKRRNWEKIEQLKRKK